MRGSGRSVATANTSGVMPRVSAALTGAPAEQRLDDLRIAARRREVQRGDAAESDRAILDDCAVRSDTTATFALRASRKRPVRRCH